MKILQFFKRHHFVLLLAAAFLAADLILSAIIPPYVLSSGRFKLNDFEVACRDHPEQVWDKVFFGNSVVISAYREDVSDSGYINLGLDYGVVTDLWEMVQKGDITLGNELVIGLNDLTLYDHFETDPSYPWHRKIYEPYCYFSRDRLKVLFTETVKQVLTDFTPAYGAYAQQSKPYYYSSMSRQALDEKVAQSPYMALPIEDFQANLKALQSLANYCQRNGIRLRVVWMPLNPEFQVPDSTWRVYEETKALCDKNGLEFYDMSDALDTACFYDIGHLNYEYGAYVFTKEIDPWLTS